MELLEIASIQPVYDDGKTVVYACCLDTDSDLELPRALSCLSHSETLRMQQFVFQIDQTRYARSRGFLRHCLGQHLGIPASAVSLGSEPHGKPFVRNADITFNLSHSQGMAVVAVSDAQAVGIDLELPDKRFERNTDPMDLGQHCFVASELDALESLSRERRVSTFLQFWTAKEARMKLWGEGMALDPKTITLCLDRGIPVGFKGSADIGLHFVKFGDAHITCCFAIQPRRNAIGVRNG